MSTLMLLHGLLLLISAIEVYSIAYYSNRTLIIEAVPTTSSHAVSSIIGCSSHCLENHCYRMNFNQADLSCTLWGKVDNSPTSNVMQDFLTRRSCTKAETVNIVKSTFPTNSSTVRFSKNNPSYGIDGDYRTHFISKEEAVLWWGVDLLQEYFVSKVRVTTTPGYTRRFVDVTIYLSSVSETDPAKFKELPIFAVTVGDLPATVWTIEHPNETLNGRYMYLQQKKSIAAAFQFSEIEIYAYKC